MKKQANTFRTLKDLYVDTDIEDSYAFCDPKSTRFRKLKKRINKFIRETKQPQPTQIKLFRFRLKHSKKTLRIPCYKDELLNFPERFTRRLNNMAMDNDVETDEEMAEGESKRCENWLREAISSQRQSL